MARARASQASVSAAPPPDAALFDTFSLVFRAFYALPPLSNAQGEPTAALYGFAGLVLKVLREQRPRRLSFALDAPARTFRAERYPAYKAGRPSTPSDLARQLERLPELLEAFGAPVFRAPGFEADDVLATLAERMGAENERALLVTGDRDLFQLVRARTQVLFVGRRGEPPALIDEQAIAARYGLPPSELPSYTALVGDGSDNLLGVPGIGPRTATKLIREHGSVGALLAARERVAPAKLRETLAEHAERARLNEELARLRTDVPLGDGPWSAPLTSESGEKLRRLFAELEFKSLLPRLEALVLSPDAR
jgi:DNA polymerase I